MLQFMHMNIFRSTKYPKLLTLSDMCQLTHTAFEIVKLLMAERHRPDGNLRRSLQRYDF